MKLLTHCFPATLAVLLAVTTLALPLEAQDKVPKTEERYDLTVFLDPGQSLEAFFKNNRVLVSAFRLSDDLEREPNGYPVTLLYPSVNVDGRSPLYPHEIFVVEVEGISLDLEAIDPMEHYLVLRFKESPLVYELVGIADIPNEDPPYDYFGNKPQYHMVEAVEE